MRVGGYGSPAVSGTYFETFGIMVSLPVYDRNGEEVGTYDIDPAELAPRISKQLLHDAVVMYQANRRQGSARTKSRAEVSGTTKKMYRQKGTGNARAGHRRSGLRRGGGHIFAKRPRDYSYRMPKKAIRLATRMALASKIEDSEIILIDELSFAEPKTKQMASILKALKLDGTLLVAIDGYDANLVKSTRNIADVSILPVGELNALEVLRPKRMLMTKAALDAFREKVKQQTQAS
jgi:large subunit ribosomal protein L4